MQSIVRQLAILVMLLAVAGCGYRPLYATDATGGSVATDLSMIAIQETGTRIGQQIRNRLISSMRPSGQEGEDAYRLVLSPNLTELAQGDQALKLGCPTVRDPQRLCRGIKRVRLTLNVSYQLYEQKSGKIVNSGRSFSNIGYDTLYEPIADRQAKANATERAVLEVSNDIRTRLAAFMASRRS
jgi:LPS-assembly lipoprotein